MTWYNTGVVAVTAASAAVTGTGTSWIANAAAGMGWVGPDFGIYEIQSINSDTSITLAKSYRGGTASGQTYALMPTQDYIRSLASQVASLIATYSAIATAAGAGKFGDGTAASPGITFGSNTNTGFYRYAANTIGVATNGVLAMVVDGLQNIGIGTGGPAYKLDVQTTNVGINARVRNSTSGIELAIRTDATTAGLDAGSGGMTFSINTSEKMRVDANGNLCVGTGTQTGTLTVVNPIANKDAASFVTTSTTGPNYGLIINSYASAANTVALIRGWVNNIGTQVFQVSGNGNVTNLNNSYGSISDAKLKENIVAAPPLLSRLMKVLIRNYNLIGDPDQKQLGVVAQELELVFPGMVEETPDYTDVPAQREVEVPAMLGADGKTVAPATTRTKHHTERAATGTVTKSVKYSVFVPMLIKGMQEQQGQIEALQLAGAAQQALIVLQQGALDALLARVVVLEAAHG